MFSLNPIIIIGSGIGGLAAAIRLRAAGRSVILCEKNAQMGGKLGQWVEAYPADSPAGEFRFDSGPSLLTMPYIFADLFAAAGKDVRNYLTLQRVDPVARFIWPDGQTFELAAERSQLLTQVRQISPSDVRGFERLLQRGQSHWPLAEPFLSHSIDQLRADPSAGLLSMILTPLRIGVFGNFSKVIDRHVRHPRLRAVLHQYATYAGTAPGSAPASLSVIPWVEHHFGGWHVVGGMYRIAEALGKLACELGVEIRTSCAVNQIRVETILPLPVRRERAEREVSFNHSTTIHSEEARSPTLSPRTGRGRNRPHVTGVELADGSFLPAAAVVVNADAVYAYRQLIAPQFRPHFSDSTLAAYDPGGSGLILMLGVRGKYPQLAHHTKFMPDDYDAELRQCFTHGRLPDDPCIYVCAPTRSDPSLAPDGCENLFVLASAPSLRNSAIDWSTAGPAYRERILQTLEARGLTDLRARIVVEKMMTPVDLQERYNANFGSIYGIAPSNWRGKFARPTNQDSKIPGLFFAGGAAHPGDGLPLVALSGKIAADAILASAGGVS